MRVRDRDFERTLFQVRYNVMSVSVLENVDVF